MTLGDRPEAVSIALFALGWCAGWVLLWRTRPLPRETVGRCRASVSVVVPARNEAGSIGALAASVVSQLRDGDELVVVDDHSTDDTAAIARSGGAAVVTAPELPTGWAGKPHACHTGASSTSGDLLVFVDADVCLGEGDLDRIAAAVTAHPGDIVSVQPWHRAVRPFEQCSMPFNIAALMGCGGFTPAGDRVSPHVAFGPVIALTRARYCEIGGHAHASVRSAVLEDIALARRVERTRLHTGSSGATTFRMYPTGLASLVEGWTKGIAIGFDATPWWAALGTAAWVSSVLGGWVTSPWFALASTVQMAVLARRAGSFRWYAVIGAPLLTVFFVVVFVRSIALRRFRRSVTWKGRTVRPDQEVG